MSENSTCNVAPAKADCSEERAPYTQRSCSFKFFVVAALLLMTGATLSVIGAIYVLRQKQGCRPNRTKNSSCATDAMHELGPEGCTNNPTKNDSPDRTSVCAYSIEARRIQLPEFLAKVKRVYYEHRPETVAWDSGSDEELAERVNERYLPYQSNPMKLKAKTDKSLSLLAELNSRIVHIDKLKPRELKTLEQLKHFLQHNFGVPYDDNYYNGDWMMGPNYFCWQPFCDIHLSIYSYGSFAAPSSYHQLESVIERIMTHKTTIDQYRMNIQLGVKTGMVRSIEDCRSGVDAIKEKSKYMTQTNKSESVLDEWYMEEFQTMEFFQDISRKDQELWFKNKNKTPLGSVQEALITGFGQPMLDLIYYMEYDHLRHCIPSEVSSGLSSLPVDFVYYNGKPTMERTTKVLPTGERLDGRESYERILSYFTTTNISVGEILKKGEEQQSLFYKEILNIAKWITNSTKTTKAVKKLKAFLNLDTQWYNQQSFPENESNSIAFKKCVDEESARLFCPVRYAALEKWKAACRETMARIHPQFTNAFHVTGDHVTLPSCPIELYPHFNPSVGTMFFEVSDEDCSVPTQFKLPFFLSRYGPKFQEWSVVAHETRPGHHAQAQGSMEYFHSHCGGMMAWLNGQISGFPAFTEGWALYSENPLMSNDTEIYTDSPIQKYGMLKWQLWRALRLIIDTGLHQRGMKRSEALELFETYAWDKTDFALKELTRYQSCPGQATAYMIGRLTIVELRKKTEQELGDEFDLKDFHYQVLSQGNAPLSFLRKYIEKYIECVKNSSSSSLCKTIVEPVSVLNELNRQRPSKFRRVLSQYRQKHHP